MSLSNCTTVYTNNAANQWASSSHDTGRMHLTSNPHCCTHFIEGGMAECSFNCVCTVQNHLIYSFQGRIWQLYQHKLSHCKMWRIWKICVLYLKITTGLKLLRNLYKRKMFLQQTGSMQNQINWSTPTFETDKHELSCCRKHINK